MHRTQLSMSRPSRVIDPPASMGLAGRRQQSNWGICMGKEKPAQQDIHIPAFQRANNHYAGSSHRSSPRPHTLSSATQPHQMHRLPLHSCHSVHGSGRRKCLHQTNCAQTQMECGICKTLYARLFTHSGGDNGKSHTGFSSHVIHFIILTLINGILS